MKQPTPRTCLYCNEVLRGRSDKKFCNDYCRNAYNNELNSEQSAYVRQINSLLKKNRKILSLLLPQEAQTCRVSRHKLSEQGYDFNYHTHQLQTTRGTYQFCYEYGLLTLEDPLYFLLVRKKS